MTDAGLVHLKDLKRIKVLTLNDTRVTDAGLVHVRDLAQLEKLWLTGTYVTDAGLVHLKSLKWLKELDLKRTNVTAAGVAGLKKSVPACRFIADPSVSLAAVEPAGLPKPQRTAPDNPPKLITNSIGMTLKLIPAGDFMMGSPETTRMPLRDEKPQHKVRISPFYLGVTEVTQAQYEAVMGNNPSHFSSNGGGKDKVAGQSTDQYPVERVSWVDAVRFCDTLSNNEGRTPFYDGRAQPNKDSNRTKTLATAYRRRRNGNTLAGREQQRGTPSAMARRN